jgi:hypothetical protein
MSLKEYLSSIYENKLFEEENKYSTIQYITSVNTCRPKPYYIATFVSQVVVEITTKVNVFNLLK